jgi:hypothetical protein
MPADHTPTFEWGDLIDDDPAPLTFVLPTLGIDAPIGTPFPCVLPDCKGSHMAIIRPRDLVYVCFASTGERYLRPAEVYASQRMGRTMASLRTRAASTERISPPLAWAWHGRLAIDSGLLTLDLPDVELEPGIRNRAVAERVFKGLVLLQGIHSSDGTRVVEPAEFSREFAWHWLDHQAPMKGIRHALERLSERGIVEPAADPYMRRQRVARERGPKKPYRYELTGRGLSAERDGQQRILEAIVTDHLPRAEAA